jgi:TonB family protein
MEVLLINVVICSIITLFSQVTTVDQAIGLYLMGDMNGSISALEALLSGRNLSLDEEIRAYHRLGAAYFGIGESAKSEAAFLSLLQLDPYYDLGSWENPQLRLLLDNVRQENMSTIVVQGEPEGALVFMNGNYVGSSPYIQDNLISGRTYTVTIMADGFEPDVQSCTTLPGQLHTMIYNMSPVNPQTSLASLDTAGVSGQSTQLAGSSQGSGDIPELIATEMYPGIISPDTAASGVSISSEPMTIEQLNLLLHGGAQMASLGGLGPLPSDNSEFEAAGTQQGSDRDPSLFQNTGGTIETSTENQVRMVFSDVSIGSESILQTDPGSEYSSRTSSEVREVLMSKESAVTFIYNKHLRSDPLLSGTVLIEMIIEPSGRVSSVSILDSSTMNPAFDLELASAVETWRFGAVDENEGPLPVTYPFNFSR